MTTNDEQAGYGEPKREPMLSDGDLFAMCMQSFVDGPIILGEKTYGVNVGEDPAAYKVRAFYENLITTGKLRVVEEVDAMCGDHGGIEGCSCSKCSAPVAPEYWMYCPGCGNKVKQ